MLLLSERTWKHHAVILLIPATALAWCAMFELPRRLRQVITGVLITSALLMMLPGLFGSRAGDLALVYGTHTLAFALLTGATVAVLVCGLRQPDGSRTESLGEISA